MMNRIGSALKRIGMSVGVILLFILAQSVAMVGLLVYRLSTDTAWLESMESALNEHGVWSLEYLSHTLWMIYPSMIIGDLLLLIPFFIVIKAKHKEVIKPITRNEFMYIFSIAVILNTALSFILEHIPRTSFMSDYDDIMSLAIGDNNFWLVLLVTGILAPIVEEVIFRYALIDILKTKRSILFAIIVSSLYFGIAHMNVVQSTYAFFFGLILGYLYTRKFNLLHSILFHLVVNSGSVIYELGNQYVKYACYGVIGICVAYMIYYVFTNKSLILSEQSLSNSL